MKNLHWKTLVLLLILSCVLGCGSDEMREDDGSIADKPQENDGSIPTVTIQTLRTEELGREITVVWRLHADPPPKTDLAVLINGVYGWVIIPKNENHSGTFTNNFHEDIKIHIVPLPVVSVVGKGIVVDLELIQDRYARRESLGGHRIPEDYEYPLYNVGEPSEITVEGPPPVHFVSAAPPSGSEIAPNATITVTFDNPPADVTVSAGTIRGIGKIRTISGPFRQGPLFLTIVWADGITNLRYTVFAPDNTPPIVTGGTVKDGEVNVDAGVINTNGKIEITFSELVVGNIALHTEGGNDMGWIGKVESNIGTLELVKGKELSNETAYVIRGKVSDAAGNEADIRITFVTKVKGRKVGHPIQ